MTSAEYPADPATLHPQHPSERSSGRIERPLHVRLAYWCLNILLLCTSVLAAYATLEFVAAPLLAAWLPLRLHGFVPEGARLLVQSSKHSGVPKDYIALAGDSYAHGYGDWLLGADPDVNGPFHSAHRLSKVTGRDVISLGSSGAGSISALVSKPHGYLAYLNAMPFVRIAPPRVFVVFFYEGNDLQDNLTDLEERFLKQHSFSELADESLFQSFLEEIAAQREKSFRAAAQASRFGPLPFYTFLDRMIHSYFEEEPAAPEKEKARRYSPGHSNLTLQRSGERALPDELQAPPAELTSQERARALYVFEQSLHILRKSFNESAMLVVYVPSPLTCYNLSSREASVQTYRNPPKRYLTTDLARTSDEVSAAVEAASVKAGALFFDARPALRRAGWERMIHGPLDWKHFNRAGYEALADAVAKNLRRQGLF